MIGDFFAALWRLATTAGLYGSAVRLAVFFAFAGTGEWVAERAGTLNISVEGMALTAAYAAAAGSDATGTVWGGLLVGALVGAVVAGVQANLSHRFTANQFVVGIAINVLALGLTSFLLQHARPQNASAGPFRFLSDLPGVFGEVLGQRWTAFLLVPAATVCWWLVYRTRWGLEVRAVGENPQAADVTGIHVNRRRRQAIYVCGVMCGLGGAYLSLDITGFSRDMTAGRGFIAIAAVIFGGWTLRGTIAGCVLFGTVEALTLVVQGYEYPVNRQLLQAAPYLATLLVMALFAKHTRQPRALAQRFVRGLT
jgi:simple sugar transport system permease protein